MSIQIELSSRYGKPRDFVLNFLHWRGVHEILRLVVLAFAKCSGSSPFSWQIKREIVQGRAPGMIDAQNPDIRAVIIVGDDIFIGRLDNDPDAFTRGWSPKKRLSSDKLKRLFQCGKHIAKPVRTFVDEVGVEIIEVIERFERKTKCHTRLLPGMHIGGGERALVA